MKRKARVKMSCIATVYIHEDAQGNQEIEEVEEVEEVKNEKVTVKKIVEHRGNFIELLENFTNIKVCEISPVLANNNYYGYEGKKTE